MAAAYETAYSSRVAARSAFRTREEITRLFSGFTLVDPGVVWVPEWRPGSPADVPEDPAALWALAGVGKRNS